MLELPAVVKTVGEFWLKVVRQGITGVLLILASGYMLWVGYLKTSYNAWRADPYRGTQRQGFLSKVAVTNATRINELIGHHEVIWGVAPEVTFASEGVISFVRENWLLLCWIIFGFGGFWQAESAIYLLDLRRKVQHERRLGEIRDLYGVCGPTSTSTSMSVTTTQVGFFSKADQSGKWFSLIGGIVGSAIGGILAQVFFVLVGPSKR
jgi:hypothetical protein